MLLNRAVTLYNSQAYIAHVLHTKHGVPVAKLAALTPYSAQREELRKQLNRRALPGVTVKTITESQGERS